MSIRNLAVLLAAGLAVALSLGQACAATTATVKVAANIPFELLNHGDRLKRAQLLEQAGDWAGLLDWGERWSESNARSAMAYYVQGRALSALKRYPEAIGAYLQTLRLDPADVNALNNLGNAYRQIGRFQDALHSYREALRVNPDFMRAWHNIGVTYYSLKGQAGIMEALKTAESINPEIAAAWQDLLLKYTRTQDEVMAMQSVRILGRQNPDDLDRLFTILLSQIEP
jgi:tetratricopeptide (TPR) repeat protein